MVFYAENSLGSSLHNNGHAEHQIKEPRSINGVPAGTILYTGDILSKFCSLFAKMSAMMPTKFPGRVKDGYPDIREGVIRSNLMLLGPKLIICPTLNLLF